MNQDTKYAVYIRRNNTCATVHVYADTVEKLKQTLVIEYVDRGWEVEEVKKI
jgi:hypothetical protein